MTVAELIKELQKEDPNMEIWANHSLGGTCNKLSNNPLYISSIILKTDYDRKGGSLSYYVVGSSDKKVLLIDVE